MGVEYVNRKDDRYYLQRGKTKTGKPRYFFGRKMKEAAVKEVPEGYEIYESPAAGQVFLRKVKATEISTLEREMVEEGIRRHAGLEYCIVDIQDNSLVVYLPDTDAKDVDKMIEMFGGVGAIGVGRAEAAKARMIGNSTYSKQMRFGLVDADERLFVVQRWCFRGSIDDWIWLDGPAPLSELVGEYVGHLGKESFFELI